jgi:hypothetical protein
MTGERTVNLDISERRERWARPLFLLTILTGSFLLFLMQPMIARMALPRLGGAPAVWNSAMLVYQALLLGGYAYAHYLSRLGARRQAGVHLALFGVAALWLPVGLGAGVLPANASPAFWAPGFLIASIGPLFFIVSAQAPLMQRWYALESARGDPYPLYAASNLGSFAGLLSYPLLFEPFLTLQQQSLAWSAGYALLVLLVALCALTIPAAAVEEKPVLDEKAPPLGRKRIITWIVLAAVPSGLMLSTTTHLTTDIVAMPLLWVVPLALYLLSFVIAFAERRGPADLITSVAPLVLLVAGGLALSDGSQQPFFTGTLGLILLFTVAVALHTRMYRLRPEPGQLTTFYLFMATGGVIGGIFCAIVAPLVFDWAYEHPILLVGAALLLPQNPFVPAAERLPVLARCVLVASTLFLSLAADGRILSLDGNWPLACSVLISLIALLFIGNRPFFAFCFFALMMSYGGWDRLVQSGEGARTRSYFGIYTISDRMEPRARMLTHGTTLHGVQDLAPGLEKEPTSYYARRSGVGHAMRTAAAIYDQPVKIGVVGLGSGTLACFAQPGQQWTFFEIDPAIVRIARDSGRFTFLRRCAPQANIVLGDARLSLARAAPESFSLLAIDAFSSDSVPMHLLTREALQVYRRALTKDGLLLIHISNRYLDLEPVLAQAAKADGWQAALYEYVPAETETTPNLSISVWIALSRDRESLFALRIFSADDAHLWRPLIARPGFSGWSDDHASILPLLEDWRNWMPEQFRGDR